MSFDPADLRDASASSNCCGAAILLPDLCEECGEHCTDDNETDPTPHCAICKAQTIAACHCGPISQDD